MKFKNTLNFKIISIVFLLVLGCNSDDSSDTSSASIIQPPGNTIFDFESDLQSWISEFTNMTLTHNTEASFILHGVGSVKGSCNITGTDPDDARSVIRYDPNPAIDMTGLTLQFYVYVPNSLANLSSKYGTKLWLYTTRWYTIKGQDISKSGWNCFTFSPSGMNENSVTVIAFQINKNDGTEEDWSGDIYFDYFSW